MNLLQSRLLAAVLVAAAAASASAATVDFNPDQDAFVRSIDPTHNYGAAGALSISGSSAVNGSGQQMGLIDSFMRFSVSGTFNALYGANNWTITGVTLKLTETSAPPQNIFNRGQGSFEIRWIANDSWVEGTGTPMGATTNGIVYNNESSILNSGTDVSLGTYSNAQTDTRQSFVLPVSGSSFINDMKTDGEVSFFMTAASPGVGFTFNSKDFTTGTSRPVLSVTASEIPEPGTVWLLVGGFAVLGVVKLCHARRQGAQE